MPYLREAVEKKRQYYIQLLIETGIYKNTDHQVHTMTLTELQNLYRQYQKTADQNEEEMM